MKITQKTQATIALLLTATLLSCATTKKFPVSTVVPAANITVKVKQQKNSNYSLLLMANNLAEPSRLSPPKKYYVVWLVSEKDGVRNMGALNFKKGNRGELNTLSPFKGSEIFITAEDESSVTYPSGQEISRVKF
jgi:hypothetical protein